jgi:hypothetical protein
MKRVENAIRIDSDCIFYTQKHGNYVTKRKNYIKSFFTIRINLRKLIQL